MIEQKSRKLQIIVLNTNLLTGREGREGRADPIDEEARRQWEWLDNVLAKCSMNKETVSNSVLIVFKTKNRSMGNFFVAD